MAQAVAKAYGRMIWGCARPLARSILFAIVAAGSASALAADNVSAPKTPQQTSAPGARASTLLELQIDFVKPLSQSFGPSLVVPCRSSASRAGPRASRAGDLLLLALDFVADQLDGNDQAVAGAALKGPVGHAAAFAF